MVVVSNLAEMPQPELTHNHYQTALDQHKFLLSWYLDTFLAYQGSLATPSGRKVALKYAKMPERYWCRGFYSFFDLLRKRLHVTLDLVREFVDYAYDITALLRLAVYVFESEWNEMLGG